MSFLPPWDAARSGQAEPAAHDPDPVLDTDDDADAHPNDLPLDGSDASDSDPAPRHRAPDPTSVLCGTLPEGVELNDVVAPASWQRSTAAEAKYIVEFMRETSARLRACLLYTSDAADDTPC
eukprot:2440764-Pyramimonas_sp.AAC.1